MSAFLIVEHNGKELGMFDGERWDMDLIFKISAVKWDIMEVVGGEFEAFFPAYEDMRQPMGPLMQNLPRLLERLPQAIERYENDNEEERLAICSFLRNVDATLRRIQQDSPTGEGWFLLAV